MIPLSLSDAKAMIEKPLGKSERKIPEWFTPDLIPFLFPIDQRPSNIPMITPPLTPDEKPRTSTRRGEDEARREAMHKLVTSWDISAKKIAKQLIDVLYRGIRPRFEPEVRLPGKLDFRDLESIRLFNSLIDDHSTIEDILRPFQGPQTSIRVHMPVSFIGGYTITETVGPLKMLTEVIRRKETVVIWMKEKFDMSHGRRRVRIIKKEGRLIMFDRFMNLIYIPKGNPSDCWQFVRGNVIALIQKGSTCTSPSSSVSGSTFHPSSQSSSRISSS
jgi:hypothetical protein